MKKTVLFLFTVVMFSSSCKKKSSCTCRDHTGKITYNEVLETRSKLEKQHFEEDCLEKQSKAYSIGNGTTTTSYSSTCVLS